MPPHTQHTHYYYYYWCCSQPPRTAMMVFGLVLVWFWLGRIVILTERKHHPPPLHTPQASPNLPPECVIIFTFTWLSHWNTRPWRQDVCKDEIRLNLLKWCKKKKKVNISCRLWMCGLSFSSPFSCIVAFNVFSRKVNSICKVTSRPETKDHPGRSERKNSAGVRLPGGIGAALPPLPPGRSGPWGSLPCTLLDWTLSRILSHSSIKQKRMS